MLPSHTKSVDKGLKRRRLVATTWIVEGIAVEWRAPVFEHSHEFPAGDACRARQLPESQPRLRTRPAITPRVDDSLTFTANWSLYL
jgi:hypothetical protein